MAVHARPTAGSLPLLVLIALAVGEPAAARQEVHPRPCGPGAARREIAGSVADLLSRRPLPGATVTLRRAATYVPDVVAVTEAGEDGGFAFCAEALDDRWDVVASLDTIVSRARPVGPEGGVDTLYVPWSKPVNLSGRVRVLGSDQGVAGARVEVVGRPVRALTDDAGAFRLAGLGAGPMVIRTTSLGLEPRVDTILAQSGTHMRLEILMSAEPIELPPIVVTAASPTSTRPRTPYTLGMTSEQVDAALPRSIDFLSLLRWSNTPGLLVTTGRDGTCVSFFRASGGCSMVEVFVNGVRVPNGSDFLASLDPSAVREFIILRPAFAQFQYMGPRTANGVLDITLR